jgi:hypothetical protein
MFLILADPTKLIDQVFQRAKNGMKERSLALKNAIHENTDGFGYGEQNREIDQYLRNTK